MKIFFSLRFIFNRRWGGISFFSFGFARSSHPLSPFEIFEEISFISLIKPTPDLDFFFFKVWVFASIRFCVTIFLFHLFLLFCRLVAFVLLENGALTFIHLGAMVLPLVALGERVRCCDRCMTLLSTSFLVYVPGAISCIFVSCFITCKKCGCQ